LNNPQGLPRPYLLKKAALIARKIAAGSETTKRQYQPAKPF